MGVFSFYLWLSQRYSKIIMESFVNKIKSLEIVEKLKNSDEIVFDNFYLDMNGIIHNCFHPENDTLPTKEVEVFVKIFEIVDHLFQTVRPKNILYLAIDGVAPRAKINQQRARRFNSEVENISKQNMMFIFVKDDVEISDTNIITPGSGFMHRLSISMQHYVNHQINNDPDWQAIKVILSDASVPGEGEHKVMEFIRRQHHLRKKNQTLKHVIYGLDADLIFLALVTHENQFYILREKIHKKESILKKNGQKNDK